MKKILPDIVQISKDSDSVELQLVIDESIAYFEGHFPQLPVLAGVVQLDWAMKFSQRYFPDVQALLRVEVLKFQSMIKPGMTVNLRLERLAQDKIKFTYLHDSGVASSGRLLLS